MKDPTRFILLHTSHPGNVGATARAMKVMGFHDLVLVQPRFDDVLSHPEALAFASGADDVLGGARIVSSLSEALDGVDYACATAMTPRDFGPPTAAPRAHLPALAEAGRRVAMVFGSERFGMRNDEVYQCHVCLSVPTSPDYGSLNLSQAVQILAYEWRMALGGFPVTQRTAPPVYADMAAVARLLSHWQDTLVNIGFLNPEAPKKLMPRLQQLAHRVNLTEQELHILHGVARAAAKGRGPGAG